MALNDGHILEFLYLPDGVESDVDGKLSDFEDRPSDTGLGLDEDPSILPPHMQLNIRRDQNEEEADSTGDPEDSGQRM